MKRKQTLMIFLVLALPMFVFGQGCFIIGPPGGGGDNGGVGTLRGDLLVTWESETEAGCGTADVVRVSVIDDNDSVAEKVQVNCERESVKITNLPEGAYTVVVEGVDPVGDVVLMGRSNVNVRPDGETTVAVDLLTQ